MAIDKLLYERKYWDQGINVLGIDEAGRGPLCGPLVVCGVSFPLGYDNVLIDDSKKLTAKKRLALFKIIIKDAREYKIVIVDAKEIDRTNIYAATKNAMQKLADAFDGVTLTDAMPLNNVKHEAIIKGDSLSLSIGAASILAKVIRDKIMDGYHVLYPQYEFNKHKGYPTKKHLQHMQEFGLLHFYRYTYQPVLELEQIRLFFTEQNKEDCNCQDD